jgi:RHS repeat-associated protein
VGQWYDEETGLHSNRHRYYDPETGCYLSPEPLGLEGSLKAYTYTDGYTLDSIDVDGRKKKRMTSVVRLKNGTTLEDKSGLENPDTRQKRATETDLHPAVLAALPPSQLREGRNGMPDPTLPGGCGEPWALSKHLNQWEATTGNSCKPDDPNWKNKGAYPARA